MDFFSILSSRNIGVNEKCLDISMRKYFIILFIMILCVMPLIKVNAQEEDTIIRVGFPQQEGLTEIDENGNYTGYTYEYLRKIAQYTGWKYEFIQIPGSIDAAIEKFLDMLQKGEIDLLGGINDTKQTRELFDLCGTNYGTAYSVIAVLKENENIINLQDLLTRKIKIALYKSAKIKRQGLLTFCEVNNINVELKEYDTREEQFDALEKGEVDSILAMDVGLDKRLRAVVKFAGVPYYFATTKGNYEIINSLDTALANIQQSDPYYMTSLYEKYFETKQKQFILSTEEQNYIQSLKPVRILVATHNAPFMYYNKEGEFCGIFKDIYELVSQISGIPFEFVPYSSKIEMEQMINSRTIDGISGMLYNYDIADQYDVMLAEPNVSVPSAMIINRSLSIENYQNKRVVLPSGAILPESYNPKQIFYVDTVTECIEMINNGEADVGFTDIYSANYHNTSKYKNIVVIPSSEDYWEYGIGLMKPSDGKLLAIINKALRVISEEERNTIILKYSLRERQEVTLKRFIEQNPQISLLIVSGIFLFTIIMILLLLHNRIKSSRQIAVDRQKYVELSELANDYIFEYDCIKDELILTEKFAKLFERPVKIEHYSNMIREDHRKYAPQIEALFALGISEGQNQTEMCFEMPNGTNRWFRIVTKAIADKDGKVKYALGKLNDINEEKQEKEKLLERSQKDGLTGILNSATIRNKIADALKELTKEQKAALIIMDIDYFKKVNDTMGHYIGDEVLRQIAGKLMELFGNDSLVGRLGGDEFIVYLPNIGTVEVLEKRCRQICKKLRREITKDGKSLVITISAGVAIAYQGQNFDLLYQFADKALYQTKQNGRNGYYLIRPEEMKQIEKN